MKKLSFLLFAIFLAFTSCTNDDDPKENESKKLDKMYQEIITSSLVNSEACTDSNNWEITALGSKACGGVASYIIYSKKIDKEAFLTKVKAYTEAQTAFDKKWNIMSTCDIIKPPFGVECVEGKPKLFYQNDFAY
ncbi:hypothetical protein DBR27_19015 [Flavobacterium sp. HMWF030]|nr:hypothetical protein DBR27_19015 [Flavobacterium sp. HMWF030]